MNRKLAFSTLGCPDWGFEQVINNASGMGFSGVEVRGIGEELQTDRLSCFLPENRDRTKAHLAAAGISICGIGTSVTFHDDANKQSALEEGRRAIDICRSMQIPAIRVFGDCFLERESKEAVIDRIASGIEALCAYSESGEKIGVLLEVHGEFNTIEALTPLLERLQNRPAFGLIWDIEHSFRAYGNNFQPFYSVIRPFIRHVHVKDCRIEGGKLNVTLPGEGQIDIPAIIAVLEQDNYDGYYSFEWEKRWFRDIPEPESAFPVYVKYMKNLCMQGDSGNEAN